MSVIGEEAQTETSEDFGFKKVGQATILPSYSGKLPYASLQNLDISNAKNRYIASSGGKVVIGDLQLLRELIQSDEQTEVSFLWERELSDVIMVKFLANDEALIVCKGGSLYSVDLSSLDEPKNVYSFNTQLAGLELYQSNDLFAMTTEGQMLRYGLSTSTPPVPLSNNLASFDILGDELYLFFNDYTVQIKKLGSDLKTVSEFSTPQELMEEFNDQYYPTVINVLNHKQILLVFGEKVSESDEDVVYDHKFFIVDRAVDNPVFRESFDVTPAFGSILRYPTSYDIRLHDLIPNCEVINVLASACSSEVTIWDSTEVVQPSQDSERAVLPISKVTDNDTNPIGVSLDVSTNGSISEPCPGVEKVDRLPLIYILNDEGSLQIVGLYHSSAIKHGNLKILSPEESSAMTGNVPQNELAQSLGAKSDSSAASSNPEIALGDMSLGRDQKPDASKELKSDNNASSGPTVQSPNITDTKSPFSSSSTGGLPMTGHKDKIPEVKKEFSSSNEPAFSTSSFGNSQSKSAFGAPSFGSVDSKPAFGAPSFGSANSKPAIGAGSFGSSESKPTFGGGSFGSSDSKPAFGAPSFGSPKAAFGAGSFGSSDSKPAFGAPSFGSSESKPTFGTGSFGSSDSKPAFGAPSFGSPKAAFGAGSFGSSDSKPAFGAPSFGSSNSKPTFGTGSFGSSDSKPAFGAPSFGSSDSKPAFGAPSFGSLNSNSEFGAPSFGGADTKPRIGTSPFGTADSTDFGKSPFSNINTHGQNEQPAFTKSSFGNFAGNNPFTSKKTEPSSFASLGAGKGKDQTSSPFKFDATQSSFSDNTSGKVSTPFSSNNRQPIASSSRTLSTSLTSTDEENSSLDEDSEFEPESEQEQHGVQTEIHDENSIDDQTVEIEEGNVSRSSTADRNGEPTIAADVQDSVDADLSDSTIEQTPSAAQVQPATKTASTNSSISAITARIKAGAKASNSDLKLTNFDSKNSLDQLKGSSPFSTFTGDLKKASSPGFSFAEIASHDEKDEDSRPNKTLAESTRELSLPKDNDEKDEEHPISSPEAPIDIASTTGEGTLNSESTNAEEIQNRDEVSDDNEENEMGGSDEPEEFTSNEIKEAIDSDVDGSQHSDMALHDENNQNSDTESSGKSELAREESYDALDDVTQGELEAAMNGARLVEDHEAPSANDKAGSTTNERAQEKIHITQGIQAPEVSDNACQTDSVSACDLKIQTFHDEESYLATQHKPKSVPSYYMGANITQFQYSSPDPIMKSIEKTYQIVAGEMSVLRENVSKMDELIVDQSTPYLKSRTKNTISNTYTWRIPESEELQAINAKEAQPLNTKLQLIEELQQQLAELATKDASPLKGEIRDSKTEYHQCQTLKSNHNLGELKFHQYKMQHGLRQKMFKVAEKFEHIEELLQILKLCAVKGQRIQDNPYVNKLVRDSADRENLLNEIRHLREEVHQLNSATKAIQAPRNKSGDSSLSDEEINSAPVVELGLQLQTRKQLGEFLKKQAKKS